MKPSPYPGFDPMRESEGWEDRDRALVLSRLHDIPPLRFFSPAKAELLDAVVDRLIPQPDRTSADRVVVTPFLDQMLFEGDTDGFRKDGMPWDQEVWHQAVVGIDETSVARYGGRFAELDGNQQDDVLSAVQSGGAEGAIWQELSSAAAFDKVVQEVVSVYYAHPSAWAEIGWPGPASRRGYMRTGYGQLDPWQPRETGSASSVALVELSPDGGSPSGSVGEPVSQFEAAPPPNTITQDFYETDAANDFVRGYSIETVGPLPASSPSWRRRPWDCGASRCVSSCTTTATTPGWAWSERPRPRTATACGSRRTRPTPSVCPSPSSPFPTPTTTDASSTRAPTPSVGSCRRPVRRRRSGSPTQRTSWAPAGWATTRRPPWSTATAAAGDVPGLYICDGSVFVTSGASNPSLTIQAIASRTADQLIAAGRRAQL